MTRNRAWRLHQKARNRNHTRKIIRITRPTEDDIDEIVTRWEKNRKPCSCFMCGNPRRGNGANDRTMQERRHEEGRDHADPC